MFWMETIAYKKAVDHKKPLKAKILDLDNPETPEKYKELFA